jgi:hypothetical protein
VHGHAMTCPFCLILGIVLGLLVAAFIYGQLLRRG